MTAAEASGSATSSVRVGRAPGRLDLLGGVADYSGALVLEVPTVLATTVTAEPAASLCVGEAELGADEIVALATMPYPEVRAAIARFERWTHYLIGVALVLVRRGVIEPPLVRLGVSSQLPMAVGVSSSAALEVATARALGADVAIDPLRLATLCQEAENHVVGAPCGIMDQVAVAMGTTGAVLPILCRPAAVQQAVTLPAGVEVVGWPTGATHDVAGDAYRIARTAAFMGKRIAEDHAGRPWAWVSEVPVGALALLPEVLTGAAFLDRWGDHGDGATAVQPGDEYPVRAATAFGVEEHLRTQAAVACCASGDAAAVAPLLAASHAGYEAIGLGHPAADALRDDALSRPGVHGARSSGGGCGGTVVVLCERGALDDVDGLIR